MLNIELRSSLKYFDILRFDVRHSLFKATAFGEGSLLLSTGGDSGGGIFRENNGRLELVGIVSGGGTDLQQLLKTGYCGQVMESTQISVFIDQLLLQRF